VSWKEVDPPSLPHTINHLAADTLDWYSAVVMAEALPPFESTSSSITPQSTENDATEDVTEDVIPILQSFQDILSTEIFVRGVTKADFRVQYGKESQHPGHFKLRMWLRKYKNVLDSESNIDIYDPAAILSLNKTFTRQIAAIEKKRKHVETQPSTIEDVATAVKVKRIRKKQASEGIELKMNTVVRKQRKLLIFDLNKVVMFHNPYFQSAILRPFAQEFIKGMHMHYNIAIWTSKNKKYIRDDIATLFGGIDLLFEWYQPACVRKPKDVSGPDALPNSFNSTSNAYSVGSEKLAYTLSKPLSKVWQCYPEFHEYNTVSG
jgi:hypothetical protein